MTNYSALKISQKPDIEIENNDQLMAGGCLYNHFALRNWHEIYVFLL